MEGVHDLGGMQGFGRVEREADEPPFHEPWEGRVHGMMLATAVAGALPEGFRYAVERMDPVHYLTSGYYEHWLAALETLLTEAGALAPGELDGRAAAVAAGSAVPERLDEALAETVRSVLRPFPVRARTEPAPRFAAGDAVRVRAVAARGHTRCPRYVRGATGRVARLAGVHLLHDALVTHGERRPEPVYAVSFRARDLWEVDGDHEVVVELWESYLEEDREGDGGR